MPSRAEAAPRPYSFHKPEAGRTVEEPQLRKRLENNLIVILREQHPLSGLFPAATREHFDAEHQYDGAWIRDSAKIASGLIDPKLHEVIGNTALGRRAQNAGVRAVRGMLRVAGQEPWTSAFMQGVHEEIDGYGRTYKKLNGEAPPVVTWVNGKKREWAEQNQPDSWGAVLTATASALDQHLMTLRPEEQETVEQITTYLLDIDVPNLEQASKWEWTQVHHPAPLATVAETAQALEAIKQYVPQHLHKRIDRMVYKEYQMTTDNYPTDYETRYGHRSKTDLATLIPLSDGALPGESYSRYFLAANPELGNGQYPGKKRFLGDHYFTNYFTREPDSGQQSEEAIWPFPYEAQIFLDHAIDAFKHGQKKLGEQFRAKGMERYFRIADVVDHVGYHTELLIQQPNGTLLPDDNDLLWHRIVMALTVARAILANRLAAA